MTLGEIEATEEFKKANFAQQQKVRQAYLNDFVLNDPEFRSFSISDQKQIISSIVDRDPVFKNPEAPEIADTKSWIEKANAGDNGALGYLSSHLVMNPIIRSTFLGPAITWTIDKLHNVIDSDNRTSEADFIIGNEGDKLNAMIVQKTNDPKIKNLASASGVIGLGAGLLEAVAVGSMFIGSPKMPKGLALAFENKLNIKVVGKMVDGAYVGGMRAGKLTNALIKIIPETANAFASGIIFTAMTTIAKGAKYETNRQDMTVGEIAKDFGLNVALDYALYGIGQFAMFSWKYLKQMFLTKPEVARFVIDASKSNQSMETIIKQLRLVNPEAASNLEQAFYQNLNRTIDLSDPVERLRILARSKQFDIDVVDSKIGTVSGGVKRGEQTISAKRFIFKANGQDLTEELTMNQAFDFLSKELGTSTIHATPRTRYNLSSELKISQPKLTEKNIGAETSKFWYLKQFDDSIDSRKIHYGSVSKVEGLGLKFVDVPDLFEAPPSTVAEEFRGARAPQWAFGQQFETTDGLRISFPKKGLESGESTPEFKDFANKIDEYIRIKKQIPVPRKFLSPEQKELYMRKVEESIGTMIQEKRGLTNDDLREHLKKYAFYTFEEDSNWRAAMPEKLASLGSQYSFKNSLLHEDMISVKHTAEFAWGDKTDSGILSNVGLESYQAVDGSLRWRVSRRDVLDRAARYETATKLDGSLADFASLTEVRAEALRKILAEGRISDASVANLIARGTGYRLMLPGSVAVESGGRPIQEYTLMLNQRPYMNDSKLILNVVDSAPTLDGLFKKRPELYEAIAESPRFQPVVTAVWKARSPYFNIRGTAFAGTENDIWNFLAKHKGDIVAPDFLESLGIKGSKISNTNILGDEASSDLVYSIDQKKILLTPFEGGKTLAFDSADEAKAFIESAVALDRVLSQEFSKFGMRIFTAPNGSIASIDEAGQIVYYRSRDELSKAFNRDLFEKIGSTIESSDENLKQMNDILGAFHEFNLASKEVEDHLEKAVGAIDFPTPKAQKVGTYHRTTIFDGSRSRQVWLDKPEVSFGWNISIGQGAADAKEIMTVFKKHNMPFVLKDGVFRANVGSMNMARSIGDDLEAIAGVVAVDGVSDTVSKITDGGIVSAFFKTPDGKVASLIDDAKNLRTSFGSFFSGNASVSDTEVVQRTFGQSLKRLGQTAYEAFGEYLGPVDETIETAYRKGVAGSNEAWKIRTEVEHADRIVKLFSKSFQGEINDIFKDLKYDDSMLLGKMIFGVDPAKIAEVSKLRYGKEFTPQLRAAYEKIVDLMDRVYKRLGITASAADDITRTASFNSELSSIIARMGPGEAPGQTLLELYEKLGMSENIPTFVKLFSNALRPEDMRMLVEGVDAKTFLQNFVEKAAQHKEMATIKDDVARMLLKMGEAKRVGSASYDEGFARFMAQKLDDMASLRTPGEAVMKSTTDIFFKTLSENLHKIPFLRDSGIADAFDLSNFPKKIENLISFSTQALKPFNVIRNSTQTLLASAELGLPQVFRSWSYVVDNPGYIKKLFEREAISQGIVERYAGDTLLARFKNWSMRSLEQSEIFNRAVMIHASESMVDQYLPRLAAGKETIKSFTTAVGADVLYDKEKLVFQNLISSGEIDAAKDYLGSIWQNITQFKFGKGNYGLAANGLVGQAYYKFMSQGMSTVAYYGRLVRSRQNLAEGAFALVKLAAIMTATKKAFEAAKIQYDGFSFFDPFSLAGGPAFSALVDLGRATRQGDRGEQARREAGRTILSTLVPIYPQTQMLRRANAFAKTGQWYNAFISISGAPVRTDDQLEYLEFMRRRGLY